jgi:hypothetical protein
MEMIPNGNGLLSFSVSSVLSAVEHVPYLNHRMWRMEKRDAPFGRRRAFRAKANAFQAKADTFRAKADAFRIKFSAAAPAGNK